MSQVWQPRTPWEFCDQRQPGGQVPELRPRMAAARHLMVIAGRDAARRLAVCPSTDSSSMRRAVTACPLDQESPGSSPGVAMAGATAPAVFLGGSAFG